jgi:hypothetical protein
MKGAYSLKASILSRIIDNNLGKSMGTGKFPDSTPKGYQANFSNENVRTEQSRNDGDLVINEFASGNDGGLASATKARLD